MHSQPALSQSPMKEATGYAVNTKPSRALQAMSCNKVVTPADVDDAFKAFASLQMLAKQERHLFANKYFMALHDTAYARFMLAFEAL